MYPKWIMQSKTIIVNGLVLLATLVVELSNFGPDLNIDPKHVLIGLTVSNLILRKMTKDPVTISKSEAQAFRSTPYTYPTAE
jgi:hypothetical protein